MREEKSEWVVDPSIHRLIDRSIDLLSDYCLSSDARND